MNTFHDSSNTIHKWLSPSRVYGFYLPLDSVAVRTLSQILYQWNEATAFVSGYVVM